MDFTVNRKKPQMKIINLKKDMIWISQSFLINDHTWRKYGPGIYSLFLTTPSPIWRKDEPGIPGSQ